MEFDARGWRRPGGLRVGRASKDEPCAYQRVKIVEQVFTRNHAGWVVPMGYPRPRGTAQVFATVQGHSRFSALAPCAAALAWRNASPKT